MPHTRGLADAFGDSVNGRSGAVADIAAALWNREDESAALSPLPDRREVFAAEGPKTTSVRASLSTTSSHAAYSTRSPGIRRGSLLTWTSPASPSLTRRAFASAASAPAQIRLLVPFSFPLLRQPVAQHLDRVTRESASLSSASETWAARSPKRCCPKVTMSRFGTALRTRPSRLWRRAPWSAAESGSCRSEWCRRTTC